MKLHPSQSIVAKDKTRFRVICCGRRWGKTTEAVEEIKGKVLYKESNVCYVAPTYQQARDIAWEHMKRELRPIIIKENESRLELKVRNLKGTESYIYLRGWESIETLRGQAFDFIVIDEVAMMRNFWVNWQEVIRPTLTDRKGEVMFISTPKGFNHFYDLYNWEGKDETFKSFQFTSYENPHIPKEELDAARKQMTEDRFAQEYLADFRKSEGLVYKEFNRKTHIFKEFPKVRKVKQVAGVDFGYTNPAAVLNILVDYDRHYWVLNEWYKTERDMNQLTEALREYSPQEVYADPEAPDKIDELNRIGFNMRLVKKGKGSVEAGVTKVKELFKQNRIHIHAACVNLIAELESYHYPDKQPDKNEPEKPVKDKDHSLDALRYAITSLERTYEEPIKTYDQPAYEAPGAFTPTGQLYGDFGPQVGQL